MTNEEAISVLIKTKVMCVSGKVTEFEKAQRLAFQSLEENDKLKAYIARLNGELKSEREWRYNARIELLDKKAEIEQLKSELQQSVKEKSEVISKIEYALNECEPIYNKCAFIPQAKPIYDLAMNYCLDLLKGQV